MKSFESEALILAGTSMVWDVLTDTGNYAVWESGIVAVSGDVLRPGWIRIRMGWGGGRSFRARVELDPGQFMSWTISLPLGLAKVVHSVTLTDYTGITHLTVRSTAVGPFRRLVSMGGPEANQVLTDLVQAVKFRAELLSFHLDGGVFPAQSAHEKDGSGFALSDAR